MNIESLRQELRGEPKFRFKQATEFVYKNLIEDWDEAISLPKDLRERLKLACPLDINGTLYKSQDGSAEKALIIYDDKSRIETVLMRHSDTHNTICVSCQMGCGMGCDFCATGKMGLKRNLSDVEIIEQVLFFARILKKEGKRISNVVFMGMGEPLANYYNVMDAVRILNDKDGLNIAARKISISTCGLVEGIQKLADEPLQVNLALSLHAPTDAVRSRIMPMNKNFGIEKTLRAIKKYTDNTNRKVMIEYVLLSGINDSIEDAKDLAHLLKEKLRHLYMVNLIIYNTIDGGYRRPENRYASAFKAMLEQEGIEVTQRFRMGHDIEGACGQLAGK